MYLLLGEIYPDKIGENKTNLDMNTETPRAMGTCVDSDHESRAWRLTRRIKKKQKPKLGALPGRVLFSMVYLVGH